MLITYLIPVYNEKKTIKKSIEIIKLLKIDKEIIVIDNGSNDGTKKILQSFKQNKKFKIIFQKRNLGFGNSMQLGLNKSKGKFVYIHFSDLEYDHFCSLKMLKIAIQKKADVVFASRIKKKLMINEMLKMVFIRPAWAATFLTTFLINFFYRYNFKDIIGTKLYNRKSVLTHIPKIKGPGFDFEFISKICKNNLKVEKCYIRYKPRANSKEKKIKPYHIINALFSIFKVKLID